MMSPKRWILLLIFYISYLMFGASIYYHIEHNLETQKRSEELKERITINEYLLEQLADKNDTDQNEVLQKITDYCGKPVTDYRGDEYEIPYTWTFYHSFFFAFTVCSTVGYGNISPTTTLGRMIMIVYSVIGIPINGILFAGLGEYFGRTFQAIYRRYKKYKMSSDDHYVPPQLGLISIITIALVPGITLFLLIPAWVFSYFEDWPYSLAFYYSYVTTTTIGFGDYVPTFQSHQPREFGGWFVVYQIFIIFWFIFALGYLLMIMTFITRGLQSKKLAFLEQQLSSNIKATQNRIWNGVTKDVGYLRRILNELYIIKLKPVYTEPDFSQFLHRSNSCPELSMYRVDPPPEFGRKRAYSECYDVLESRTTEVTPRFLSCSDTELDKIDKEKSYEAGHAFRQTTDLLSKVVNALAIVKPPEEDTSLASMSMYGGYHGFSDSQILASEWSFGPPKPRERARSDFYGVGVVNPGFSDEWQMRRPAVRAHNEWTWSGDNNQIQQAINRRYKQNDRDRNMYRSNSVLPPDYIVHVEEDDDELAGKTDLKKENPFAGKKMSIPDGLRKLFPFNRKRSTPNAVGSADNKRKFSIMSVPETTDVAAPFGNVYSTVTANASPSFLQSMANGTKSAKFTNGLNGRGVQNSSSFPSDVSITSRSSAGAVMGNNNLNNAELGVMPTAPTSAYQRNTRKRRESNIFAPNPVMAARRGSLFPTSASAQRRGSLFNNERRGSTASNVGIMPPPPPNRRGSLFPTALRSPLAANERRPSLFETTEEANMDVLENTTLADLIRALEVMHTQAVFEEANTAADRVNDKNHFKDKKKKKLGNATMEVPSLPPILSLFGGDNSKTLNAAAANRLYARRATVVGSLPSASFSGGGPTFSNLNLNNVLTRRRQSNAAMAASNISSIPATNTTSSTSSAPKFKRRFSVRPTALAIPPGKAPPVGSNFSSLLLNDPLSSNLNSPSAATANTSSSQTTLQRRLSLRPSPLARELSIPSSNEMPNMSTSSSGTNSSLASPTSISSSSRLLSPNAAGALAPRTPNTTSSTHSPLSRIVQIAQAQRKSSMPEGFALDRTKKPDGSK